MANARGPGEVGLERARIGGGDGHPAFTVRSGTAIRGIVAVVDTATAADGTYAFTGLSLGSYTVTALLSAAGVSRTSDTDGAADWVVNVSVTGAAEVSASFAGVGKGALGGTVLSVGTQAPD